MDQPEPLSPGADKICGGCKDLIDNDAAGTVVSFGAKYFHIDCFRCSKCQERVTADTNLLLLSDGTPVCSTCSYQCVVCGLPIMDEAIMTGAFQPPSFPSSRACLLPTRSQARSGAGELTFD